MSEITDKDRLERRRQKRLQKILQSGESRLNKITGTAYQYKQPTPSPSSSYVPKSTVEHTPAIHRSASDGCVRLQRRDSDDPPEELGAPEIIMDQTAFNSLLDNERLEDMLNKGFLFNPVHMNDVEDISVKYWNLLHLFMMCLLGCYAVYTEWTQVGVNRFASLLTDNTSAGYYPAVVPLFWYYITLELCIQSARLFYQKGHIESTSTLTMIATQLPDPLGPIVTICLRYRLIWTCLVQDMCVLVFIIGLSQLISSFLINV